MRVIPSTMVGGAIAGGLSMYFGCTLMAPHGGLFVLAIPVLTVRISSGSGKLRQKIRRDPRMKKKTSLSEEDQALFRQLMV
ncbi:hypothetical protein MJI37_33190, partial [Salmonella enterica subsp. enterica serovar Cerro]|nr:hypothetical protein [Salmonella enterica subsp. enterica serovar Cerro]